MLFPLHVLLADAIETCGGSNRLARLFNRFGTYASPLATFSTGYMLIEHGYPDDAFIIASPENLDFIHSYAMVINKVIGMAWHNYSSSTATTI